MVEIKETIKSYTESINKVQERIWQLNHEIALTGGEGNPRTKKLAKRRYTLYQQLWEMQGAQQSLKEYVEQVTKRTERGKTEGNRYTGYLS